MLAALTRFGLSARALAIIKSLYQDPTFHTLSQQGDQASGRVGSGIRQGCPLSPYLFIMVLTVLLEDVDAALLSKGVATNTWSVGRPTHDLEYADDTLLISLTTTQMESLLHELETQAELYGMHLNQTKTEVLHDARKFPPKVRFKKGEIVQTTTHVKYLGSLISWERSFDTAFKHRAGIAEFSYKKLRLLWNSSLSRKSTLKIFQSIFLSTLTYGLETLTLQDKFLKRVDAYYIRFLRRIVGIKASHYSRIPNNEVWRRARYPKKPSEFLLRKQTKLLEQVFLASDHDPLKNVVFNTGYKDRIKTTGRRRGGKIPYWIEVTTQRHFKSEWDQHSGRSILGDNTVYAAISRAPRASGTAPMRASNMRARR